MTNNNTISVLDFAWQDFNVFIQGQATIGDLLTAASKTDHRAFMFFDPFYRISAVVNPAEVFRFDTQFRFEPYENAVEIGLVDVLRQGQVRVSMNKAAREVAEIVIAYDIALVTVVDGEGKPVGIFSPRRLLEHLPRSTMVREQSSPLVREMVRMAARTGDLAAAIRIIEGEHSSFHSEGINSASPDPYYCSGCRSFVPTCPCRKHNSADCAPVEFAWTAF